MWIGNMHLNIVPGDFIFKEWEEDGWKKFDKQVHKLRKLGFRKINQEYAMNGDYFEYYRQKGKKKIVTLTMMCM